MLGIFQTTSKSKITRR